MTDPDLNARYQAALAAYQEAVKRLDVHVANRTLPTDEEFRVEETARAELIEARRALWKFRGLI